MPTTPRGIVYPDATGHERLWEHWQAQAESVQAALDAFDAVTQDGNIPAGATRAGLNNYDLSSVAVTAATRDRLVFLHGGFLSSLNSSGKASLRLYAGATLLDRTGYLEVAAATNQHPRVSATYFLPANTAVTFRTNVEVLSGATTTSYGLNPEDRLRAVLLSL